MTGVRIGLVIAVVVVLFLLYGWTLTWQSDIYVFSSRKLIFSLRETDAPADIRRDDRVYWRVRTENRTTDTLGIRLRKGRPGLELILRDRALNYAPIHTDFFLGERGLIFRQAMEDTQAVKEEIRKLWDNRMTWPQAQEMTRDLKAGPIEYLLLPPGEETTLFAMTHMPPNRLEIYRPDSLHVGRVSDIGEIRRQAAADLRRSVSLERRTQQVFVNP